MPRRSRVHVHIVAPGWRRAVTIALVNFTRTIVTPMVLPAPVTVRYTTDAEMRDLNHRFRGKDKATNVLSFQAHEADYLGDIALGLETVVQEAQEQGKTPAAHTAHLLVHGALHLLGFDHEDDADAAIMQSKEIDILKSLGYKDPYA
ncbi:MAG: rRNA maturation RNase YbeY [Holosporales bacterium]|jgi:probable rRNA maturation factor